LGEFIRASGMAQAAALMSSLLVVLVAVARSRRSACDNGDSDGSEDGATLLAHDSLADDEEESDSAVEHCAEAVLLPAVALAQLYAGERIEAVALANVSWRVGESATHSAFTTVWAAGLMFFMPLFLLTIGWAVALAMDDDFLIEFSWSYLWPFVAVAGCSLALIFVKAECQVALVATSRRRLLKVVRPLFGTAGSAFAKSIWLDNVSNMVAFFEELPRDANGNRPAPAIGMHLPTCSGASISATDTAVEEHARRIYGFDNGEEEWPADVTVHNVCTLEESMARGRISALQLGINYALLGSRESLLLLTCANLRIGLSGFGNLASIARAMRANMPTGDDQQCTDVEHTRLLENAHIVGAQLAARRLARRRAALWFTLPLATLMAVTACLMFVELILASSFLLACFDLLVVLPTIALFAWSVIEIFNSLGSYCGAGRTIFRNPSAEPSPAASTVDAIEGVRAEFGAEAAEALISIRNERERARAKSVAIESRETI
jgi:hypothetical protein